MGARRCCCAGPLGALLGNVPCGAACPRPRKEFGPEQVQGRASLVCRGWGSPADQRSLGAWLAQLAGRRLRGSVTAGYKYIRGGLLELKGKVSARAGGVETGHE